MTPEEEERIQQIDILYQDGQVKLRPHQIQDDIHFLLSLIDKQEKEIEHLENSRSAHIHNKNLAYERTQVLQKDFEVMRGLAIDLSTDDNSPKRVDEEFKRRRNA